MLIMWLVPPFFKISLPQLERRDILKNMKPKKKPLETESLTHSNYFSNFLLLFDGSAAPTFTVQKKSKDSVSRSETPVTRGITRQIKTSFLGEVRELERRESVLSVML